jgi:ribosome-associated protein
MNATSTQDLASPADATISAQVQDVVTAALDHKAEHLKVLHLAPVTDFTDFFLIMSGTNSRQVQAIADAVLEKLGRQKVKALHVEGQNQANWVLLDYGDFVVHVFEEERREFYALERLWADATDVTEQFTAAA